MPYRTPELACVRPAAWLLNIGGELSPLPEALPTWDAATDLSLERTIDIDVEQICEQSALSTGARLAVGVVWYSDRHLRGCAALEDIPEGQPTVRSKLSFTLAGRDMGERLTLDTRLMLAESREHQPPATAHDVGSQLWSHQKVVRLQGLQARFPLAIVDPAVFFPDPTAPWFLQLRPELDAPILGAVHLLLNQNNHAVCAAATALDADSAIDPIMSAIRYDVGRTLLDFALEQEELWSETDWPKDSFGASLRFLVTSSFPNESRTAVLARRQSDPAGWAAAAAGRFGLMAGLAS